MLDLAVVIVNWNVRDMLADCLRSVQTELVSAQLSGQIWVVDNASTDSSVEMLRRDFPEVRLIASTENLGFAGGNNAALRAIGFGSEVATDLPEAVLLLNPDTIVQPGAFSALVDFLKNTPQAGIAGVQLCYGDGSFQHSAFAFPGLWQLAIELLPLPGRLVESSLNGRYTLHLYEKGIPFQVGHPLGAAICVRGEAIQQVGLLDEDYHMYVEEVDWSKRIVSKGWRAYCVPQAKITHFGGQSTGQIKISSFINLWTSRYLFYRKHYHPLKLWLAGLIVRIGMQRKASQDIEGGGNEKLEAYKKVANIWQGEK